MRLALTRDHAVSAFWHLLFLDVFFLSWRYGGVSMVDALIHGCVLLAATVLLLLGGARRPIGPLFFWAAGLVLATAFLLLIPLPEPLFALLAPIKHRITSATTAIYPEIPVSTAAAMMPGYHLTRSALLVGDLYLVFLLLSAPAPRRLPLAPWSAALSIALGLLTVTIRYGGADIAALAPWRDTVGGFVNDNHFAALAVALMLLSAHLAVRAYANRRSGETILHVLALVCLGIAFLEAYSRAGLVLLVLGFLIWLGLSRLLAGSRRDLPRAGRRWLSPVTLALALVPVLLFTAMFFFSASGEKLRSQGLEMDNRIAYNRLALAYLGEGQVLGTGLGSVISLIDPAIPKTIVYTPRVHRLHNEYLQVLLELGLPGLAALLIVLYLLLEPIYNAGDRLEPGFAGVVWAIVAVMAAHSLIEFPLRMLSIRVFVLLLVGLAGALARPQTTTEKRLALAPALLLLLASIAFLVDYVRKIPDPTSERDEVHRSMLYGRPFRLELLEGQAVMDRLLWQGVPIEEAGPEIERARGHLYASLREWPYNLRAMNLLFMAEMLEHKIEDPSFRREDFDHYRARAEAIGALGHPSAPDTKLARFFLYGLYLEDLDEAERKQYMEWKKTLWLLLRSPFEPSAAEP